jgi:hypothetical protein
MESPCPRHVNGRVILQFVSVWLSRLPLPSRAENLINFPLPLSQPPPQYASTPAVVCVPIPRQLPLVCRALGPCRTGRCGKPLSASGRWPFARHPVPGSLSPSAAHQPQPSYGSVLPCVVCPSCAVPLGFAELGDAVSCLVCPNG